MSGSFVRSFGVVVFARRPPSPVHRLSSSVGYLHCRRNEFLPVNKRVDFTTVNQATRRFRPLRHPNLLSSPFSIASSSFCSSFLSFFFRRISSSFFLVSVVPISHCCTNGGFFHWPWAKKRLLCLIRYWISLMVKGLRWTFIKLKLAAHPARQTRRGASAHMYIRHPRRSSFQFPLRVSLFYVFAEYPLI